MFKRKDEGRNENTPYDKKTYAYIAIALIVLGVVFFGLIFTVLSIYALIASILFQLCALAFVNIQQKKNNFSKLIIIKICAYVALIAAVLFFLGGIIYMGCSG